MKFAHLSDLHIGKRVNEFSMLEEQSYIFHQILDAFEKENVEGVLIAGDIYDKTIPSADAVSLFDEFLTKMAERSIPIFLISGNHDSPERIAFGSRLLQPRNVFVSPVYNGKIEPVELQDSYGSILVYMIPFIKPALIRHLFPEELIESYSDAFRVVLEHLEIDHTKRTILIAHQFLTGAKTCESEEISVGGLDNIDVTLFDEFDYVALGHLHRPQNISRDTVRYCGSPLKYSFSEVQDHKSITILDILEKGNILSHTVPLIPKRDFCEIKGLYREITERNYYKELHLQDYFHITLTDEEEIPEALGKLRAIYPNIMKLDYDNKRTRSRQDIQNIDDMEKQSPLQLFTEFYKLQNNQDMTEEQYAFSSELMEKIWGGMQ